MADESSTTALYDRKILDGLDFSKFNLKLPAGCSYLSPSPSLVLRPLQRDDFDKGYLQLLSKLTQVGDVTRDIFYKRFDHMKSWSNSHYVTVIEDTSIGKIIGNSTLIIEQKFIHCATYRGRIEDVILDDAYRGKQLAKVLVGSLVLLSEKVDCYKLTLECTEDYMPFYQKFGLATNESRYMQKKFFDVKP